MKQSVSTDNAPNAPFYSQAIVSGNTIYLAGQVHISSDNTLVGDTTEERLAQIMKNIEAVLRSADANLTDIVKVVLYVIDITIMPELNKAYATYFSDPFPVREAVCVSALPLGASIEMSVVAVKD
jgi:2-iminobutanoate/2-iminopropanoate deaminase